MGPNGTESQMPGAKQLPWDLNDFKEMKSQQSGQSGPAQNQHGKQLGAARCHHAKIKGQGSFGCRAENSAADDGNLVASLQSWKSSHQALKTAWQSRSSQALNMWPSVQCERLVDGPDTDWFLDVSCTCPRL